MIDFEQFYYSVHEYQPFPWQSRLAKQIAKHGWQEDLTIRLPTASGKTSLVDVAIYALAAQCDRFPADRTVPLRTFFVVDRRLVVDDVTEHARKLQVKLNTDAADGLSEIRERLRSYGTGRALDVATLRGGMYRSNTWADSPDQPLICISTVDQVGSRLLFRGYGVGDRRRSVDAALVGCDSVIILDEAHLSQPFRETVGAVQKYAGWAELALRPVKLVQMSATADKNNAFSLEKEDYENEKLAQRLNARKLAELRETASLEEEAASEAKRLASKSGIKVVGIVVNTVNTARSIFEKLRAETSDDESVLLTGRIRPYDRDKLMKDFLHRMKTGRNRKLDTRIFVIATQTIEVGADLDFDALVSEAAPLDALRQRFGRLDRIGELRATEAVILRRKLVRGKSDPVYGEAIQRTWDWLTERAEDERGRKRIDFAAKRMQDLYDSDGTEGLCAATAHAPSLTPAHIETWIQTYPTPSPDPDLAAFLHGIGSGGADVALVWRADLEDAPLAETWTNIVSIAPPVPAEALTLPIWVARSWLRKGKVNGVSDLEGSLEARASDELRDDRVEREFLIWRGLDDSLTGEIDLVRPGDTLVLRSSEGGADRFGWKPESPEAVSDVGNDCICKRARQAGGKYIVRLYPGVSDASNPDRQEELALALQGLQEDPDEQDTRDLVLSLIRERYPGLGWTGHSYPNGKFYFSTKWTRPSSKSPESLVEETDEDDTASFTVCVPLDDHVDGVVALVERFAAASGVEPGLAAALKRAAELHDLGKSDQRFQVMLGPCSENPGVLLGKSAGNTSRMERERRRRLASYPRNARHEFWSVALAEKLHELGEAAYRDLVLYVIGTHHGYGRPFAPVWNEEESVEFGIADGKYIAVNGREVRNLWRLGSGWVDRFWRLNRKYGYWSLAYLETILRRADCVRSRNEQEKSQ